MLILTHIGYIVGLALFDSGEKAKSDKDRFLVPILTLIIGMALLIAIILVNAFVVKFYFMYSYVGNK